MDLYSVTLKGLEKLLSASGKKAEAEVISECIEKWETSGDSDMLRKEFEPTGRLAGFRLDSSNIDDPVKGFWTARMFSALVAMAAQLADFAKRRIEPDMEFIRKNFGTANEIMTAGKCGGCGRFQVTMADIDKYASMTVIAGLVVKGLEKGDLEDAVRSVMELTAPEISRERRRVRIRIENTGLPILDQYSEVSFCPLCGSRKIVEGKLLRSLRDNVFVPLDN